MRMAVCCMGLFAQWLMRWVHGGRRACLVRLVRLLTPLLPSPSALGYALHPSHGLRCGSLNWVNVNVGHWVGGQGRGWRPSCSCGSAPCKSCCTCCHWCRSLLHAASHPSNTVQFSVALHCTMKQRRVFGHVYIAGRPSAVTAQCAPALVLHVRNMPF